MVNGMQICIVSTYYTYRSLILETSSEIWKFGFRRSNDFDP